MNSIESHPPMCTNCQPTEIKWDVSEVISFESWNKLKYAVLILNRPLTQKSSFLVELWSKATVTMTVDGGTRRWDTFFNKLNETIQKCIQVPTLITGDFDSITPDILDKYKSKGCKLKFITVICQSSGRLDQIMGNIQTLYLCKYKKLIDKKTNVYLMADDSLSWILYPGEHTIVIPEEIRTQHKAWCSLVPVGEKCERIKTSGLKWDIDNCSMKFGDLISTSNTYNNSSSDIKIKCSHPVLWSMKIPNIVEKTEINHS